MKYSEQYRRVVLGAVAFAGVSYALTACGSAPGLQGIYADTTGGIVLELKSAGKATFSFVTQIASCTYSVKGETLTLDCPEMGKSIPLTIHEDGSITGPPDGFLPILRKRK